ncbi:MAG: NADPH:quinone reductase [Candidatus Acidiferrales bacterium]
MKAIIVRAFGGPEVLQLEDAPDLQPGPTQVVIRNHAAGVNPVDTYIRAGTYARKPSLPYTPGLDAAGVVERVGASVKGFKVGDRVYVMMPATGTYAQQVLCEENSVHSLPEHVSFKQGAAIAVPYSTAFRALFHKAHARGGETVFIHGASGGTGIAAVQLAHAAGLQVIGTAGTAEGKKLAEKEGAQHVLDHHSPGYLEQAMTLTGGRGMDVIIEMLANVNLGKDLPLLAIGGRAVIVGNRGTVEINPRDAMGREAVIYGMTLWATSPEDMASIHGALRAGLENKSLRPVVGAEFPLSEAAKAQEAVTKPGAHGKIVLLP